LFFSSSPFGEGNRRKSISGYLFDFLAVFFFVATFFFFALAILFTSFRYSQKSLAKRTQAPFTR
jgi:hypothetical protein